MSSSPAAAKPQVPDGNKLLQERLHLLLGRLAATCDIIRKWPESDGDDASIHVATTNKLIASIQELVSALKRVEGVIKDDAALKKMLQDCPVPLDLLVLLDHGNGLNPDCFSRGLLKEASGQLAGLKRRKMALNMLGAAVQSGWNKRHKPKTSTAKRSLEEGPGEENDETAAAQKEGSVATEPPVAKRLKSG